MRRSVTLTAGALAALALATVAGCSTSGKPSAATTPTTSVAGTSSGSASSPTAALKAPSTAHNASAGSVDVCSLLTAVQATTLNKVTYSSTTPGHPASGYDTCTYKNTGSADPVNIQDLTVSVLAIPNCWTGLQSADGPGPAISGVGDAAFGARIGMDIKLGSRCVTIQGLTDAELRGNYAPDTAMARIILAKLG